MSVFERARELALGSDGDEMDAPHGGEGGLYCEECGATETTNGNPFTPATLGRHKRDAHGIAGTTSRDSKPKGRGKGRGRPRSNSAPRTSSTARQNTRVKAERLPAPTLNEISDALVSASNQLRWFKFDETAAELDDIAGPASSGLAWLGKKNSLAAMAVRALILLVGCGTAIFGLARVGRVFADELRARRTLRMEARGGFDNGIVPANADEL